MATIREMAIKYAPHPTDKNWEKMQEQITKLSAYEKGAVDVLKLIETHIQNLNLGNSAEEKFYKLDIISDIGLYIKKLKGE